MLTVLYLMAWLQMLPVPTAAAKPTYDDMASLFWKHVLCVSDGIHFNYTCCVLQVPGKQLEVANS